MTRFVCDVTQQQATDDCVYVQHAKELEAKLESIAERVNNWIPYSDEYWMAEDICKIIGITMEDKGD